MEQKKQPTSYTDAANKLKTVKENGSTTKKLTNGTGLKHLKIKWILVLVLLLVKKTHG